MRPVQTLITCLLFTCFSWNSLAQEESAVDDSPTAELWTDLTLTYPANPKLTVGGDFGFRFSLNSDVFRTFYIRPYVKYQFLKHINIVGGLGSFNTLTPDIPNTYEIRFFEDLNISWPTIKWAHFFHRFRLEQRFFNYQGDELDSDFSFRGRYMLGFRTNRFSIFGSKKDYTFVTSLEPFFPLGDDAVEIYANSSRIDFGLSYHVSKKLRIELDYIIQRSRVLSDDDFKSTGHILRLRIFQGL